MALSIEDQLAIQQLYAKYNHHIDFGQAEAWAACFTPGGTFNGGGGVFTGPEALAGFAKGYAQNIKGRHWTNNLVLEGDGRSATGSCYLILWNIADPRNPSILTTAIYTDELEKTDGGWRFTKRTVTPDATG